MTLRWRATGRFWRVNPSRRCSGAASRCLCRTTFASTRSRRTTACAARRTARPSPSAERRICCARILTPATGTAALRVLLRARASARRALDRDVCAAVVLSGAFFHEHYALAPGARRAAPGQRILNILEQARTDNILCRRFPGYLPLLRFVCYAQLDAAAPGSALEALLESWRRLPSRASRARTPALQSVCAQVEAAILAPSAAACAQHCRQTLTTLAPELARRCREADDDARARIASQCVVTPSARPSARKPSATAATAASACEVRRRTRAPQRPLRRRRGHRAGQGRQCGRRQRG